MDTILHKWLLFHLRNKRDHNITYIKQGSYKKLQPFFKNFSRTTFGFQGPPTRNVIFQTVQKCTFPVHSNRTLSLKCLLHHLLYIFSKQMMVDLLDCTRLVHASISLGTILIFISPCLEREGNESEGDSLIPIVLHVSNF